MIINIINKDQLNRLPRFAFLCISILSTEEKDTMFVTIADRLFLMRSYKILIAGNGSLRRYSSKKSERKNRLRVLSVETGIFQLRKEM